MADREFILAPASVRVEIEVDEVALAMHSMAIINIVDEFSGMGEWVEKTARKLTPGELKTNHLVAYMQCEIIKQPDVTTFPQFLNLLHSVNPVGLRDQIFERYYTERLDDLPREVILADVQVFLDQIRKQQEHKIEKGLEFDEAFWREMHGCFVDPVKLHSTLVEHLTMMWDRFLAEEWQHGKTMVYEAAEAHRQMDYAGLSFFEAVEAVAGRDLRGNDHYREMADKVAQITFIPSQHIGPYIGWVPSSNDTHWKIIFGARPPRGGRAGSVNLTRSEMLIRLSALADDTRLQMIELLARHTELCAQDFITMLDLSQSSASRHLRQLTASGYLIERRREVAKCYSLNQARIDDTLSALKTFLKRP